MLALIGMDLKSASVTTTYFTHTMMIFDDDDDVTL